MKKTYIMGTLCVLVLIFFPYFFEGSMKGTDHIKILITTSSMMLLMGAGARIIEKKKEEKTEIMLQTMSWVACIGALIFILLYFVNVKEKSFLLTFFISSAILSVGVLAIEVFIRKILKKPPK